MSQYYCPNALTNVYLTRSNKTHVLNMKNVLILHNSLDYCKSGVERVSFLLRNELECRSYNCFEGCVKGENVIHQKNVFEYDFNEPQRKVSADLFAYINEHDVGVIIIQGLFDPNLNKALFRLKKKRICKIVFCLHNAPSAYKRKTPLSLLSRIKIFIWYLIKFKIIILDYRNHRLKMLAEMFGVADRFVLLSKTYIDELSQIIKKKSLDRISCINNPLSFRFSKVDFSQKKQQVLILGRLEEFQKNISSALRIWKMVENAGIDDWTLLVVGSGGDEQKLKDYAADIHLKNCTFLGKTSEPEKYYQESALFMMTSHIEGWPMTLLEAQQFGSIPVVFNSFAALSEIIEHKVNGFVVERNNESLFAKTLVDLMRNNVMRRKMFQDCINRSQKYSSKFFGDNWDTLLRNL